MGLLRAPGTGGHGGVYVFPPTSYQSGQAYGEEGSVTPWKPMAGSAGPGEGVGRSVLLPRKLPGRATLLCSRIPTGMARRGAGSVLSPETPLPQSGWLGWLMETAYLPLPLVYTLTLWEVLFTS